jgi:hypothetical protein
MAGWLDPLWNRGLGLSESPNLQPYRICPWTLELTGNTEKAGIGWKRLPLASRWEPKDLKQAILAVARN